MDKWRQYSLFPPYPNPFDIRSILRNTSYEEQGAVDRSFRGIYRSSARRPQQHDSVLVYDASSNTNDYCLLSRPFINTGNSWVIIEILISVNNYTMAAHLFNENRNLLQKISPDDFRTILYNNPHFCDNLIAKIVSLENGVLMYNESNGLTSYLASQLAATRFDYANMSRQENMMGSAYPAASTVEVLDLCTGLDGLCFWPGNATSVAAHLHNNRANYYNNDNLFGSPTNLSRARTAFGEARSQTFPQHRVPLYERKSVFQPNINDVITMFCSGERVQSSLETAATSLQQLYVACRPVTLYVEAPDIGRREVASNYTATVDMPLAGYLLCEDIPSYCVPGIFGNADVAVPVEAYTNQESTALHTERWLRRPVTFYKVLGSVNEITSNSSHVLNNSHLYRAENVVNPAVFRQNVNENSFFISKETKTSSMAKPLETFPSVAYTGQMTVSSDATGVDYSMLSKNGKTIYLPSRQTYSTPKETKDPNMANRVTSSDSNIQSPTHVSKPYTPPSCFRNASTGNSCSLSKETKAPTMAETVVSTRQESTDSNIKSVDRSKRYLPDRSYGKFSKENSCLIWKETKGKTIASTGQADSDIKSVVDTLIVEKAVAPKGEELVDVSLPMLSQQNDVVSVSSNPSATYTTDDDGGTCVSPRPDLPAVVNDDIPSFSVDHLSSMDSRPTASNAWKSALSVGNNYYQPILGAGENNNAASVLSRSAGPKNFHAGVLRFAEISYCKFCKKNREEPHFYNSHVLKDRAGNIRCPILFSYVCNYCGATGSMAHTDSHCSRNPNRAGSAFKKNPW